MKCLSLVTLLLLSLAACTPKRTQQPAPTSATVPVEQPDTTGVEDYLESLYSEVFARQLALGYMPRSEEKFTHRLRDLWDEMPQADAILDADIWTGVQDFDTLALLSAHLDTIVADTALATVRLSTWRRYEQTARLRLVREVHDSLPPAWYVDNIVHLQNHGPYDVDATIRMNMPDSVVHFLGTDSYSEEDNAIELRFYRQSSCPSYPADGYMWTTSDEFYDAREGFYPGFAILRMQRIELRGDTLSFHLDSRGEHYFSGPVPLTHHTSRQALRAGCHPWGQPAYEAFYDSVAYQALVGEDHLRLIRHKPYYPYLEERLFSRVSSDSLATLIPTPAYEPENRRHDLW